MKNFMTKSGVFFMAFLVAFLGSFSPLFAYATELEPSKNPDSSFSDPPDEAPEPPTINEDLPDLFFRAINPGYTKNGKSNVGEMIEIVRKSADTPLSLAGATVGYTTSSGKYSVLLEFPENSWMTGETLLLRLASSPGSELANENYTKTIAMSGSLDLTLNGEVLDQICWTGKDECYASFKSANPTTLVRNLETGEWQYQTDYTPDFHAENYYLKPLSVEATNNLPSQCQGLQFSEILSYYDTGKDEQFIEFHNPTPETIALDGCALRYKNKSYALSGNIQPEGYHAYYPTSFTLTKNPTTSNTLELIDTNGAKLDELEYKNGQRKGTAYALIGYGASGQEIWKTTYAPTPGEPNNYQEFKSCEPGKVLNQATGNCVKVASVKTTVCKEGYYLNPLTGRCNKIKTAEAKTCKEGYELNPKTNRCVKIKQNTGADYSLEPENHDEQSSFIALYAVLGVVAAGVIYLIYEFRHEIAKIFRKIFHRR